MCRCARHLARPSVVIGQCRSSRRVSRWHPCLSPPPNAPSLVVLPLFGQESSCSNTKHLASCVLCSRCWRPNCMHLEMPLRLGGPGVGIAARILRTGVPPCVRNKPTSHRNGFPGTRSGASFYSLVASSCEEGWYSTPQGGRNLPCENSTTRLLPSTAYGPGWPK